MKRFLILLCLVGLLVSCGTETKKEQLPIVIAHRGCWLDDVVPENSLAAVGMAKRFGYTGIECDVKYTADSVMVILHDGKLNRTARLAKDYSELKEPVHLKDLTFEELRRDYVLASADPALRTPIPTLEELLNECKKQGVLPMLHSEVWESYELAQKMMGDNWICFTVHDSLLREARKITNCLILMDPHKEKNQDVQFTMERLRKIGGKCGVSSMNRKLLTKEYCDSLRANGFEIQSSIFQTPHEVQAVRNGITILLTDFSMMPNELVDVYKNDHWSIKNKSLKAGEVAENVWANPIEYGGLTVEVEFVGTIEVVMNGERTYTLTRTEPGKDYIGLRFLNKAPSVKITAKEESKLVDVNATVYKF
ncbi:MAG: hypothetical protein IJ430_07675 [Parabacteroides sp.]|nr:hypothetical protein [Parabacteroides sp.]